MDDHEALRPDRRRFCAGLAVLGASACVPTSSNQIGVGGLDGGSLEGPGPDGDVVQSHDLAGAPPQDLAQNPGADLAQSSSPDLAQAASCSGNLNAGPASAVTTGSPVHTSNVFVCRDSGGLYAMSSKCTHSGCTLTPQPTQFYCNCHYATFDLNGQNPTSPAYSPLKHYAMCVDSSGNVEVDTSTTVDPSTRA